MTEEAEEAFQDSGPFCVHWSDFDCDALCKTCGHRCSDHCGGHASCDEKDCTCEKFVDEESNG